MKVLLTAINGKYYHTALGIYSLRAAAEAKGFAVSMKEWTVKSDLQQMLAEILRESPDVLGCSVYIWNVDLFQVLCALVKEQCPEMVIVWGGPEVTGRGCALLKSCSYLDYLLLGEGEEILPALLAALATGIPCRLAGAALAGFRSVGFIPSHSLL